MSDDDPILDAVQMADKEPLAQARKAVFHMLGRIADNPAIGWYCGAGSQAFALLTEAYATLAEEAVRQVRLRFLPKAAANPEVKAEESQEECVASEEELLGPIDHLDAMLLHERGPALREIRVAFCSECNERMASDVCFCNARQIRRRAR